MGQSSRALPEYREVMRADLNIPPSRVTSARVAEVDLGSEDEFQDSKEDPYHLGPWQNLSLLLGSLRYPLFRQHNRHHRI